jgi:hypothetical protein
VYLADGTRPTRKRAYGIEGFQAPLSRLLVTARRPSSHRTPETNSDLKRPIGDQRINQISLYRAVAALRVEAVASAGPMVWWGGRVPDPAPARTLSKSRPPVTGGRGGFQTPPLRVRTRRMGHGYCATINRLDRRASRAFRRPPPRFGRRARRRRRPTESRRRARDWPRNAPRRASHRGR